MATMSTALASQRDERIEAVRRFNRLYTSHIGVLQHGYLRSPFSLTEVRVLYELAHRPCTVASQLARELELDPGYLSRILRTFGQHGLLERTPSERDGRESILSLSAEGQATFAPLDSAARDQIGAMLAVLAEPNQVRLLAAMRSIESLLADGRDRQPDYILREARVGDFGWVVQRHGALYAAEYNWDAHFEALVGSIVAKFVEHFDPERERCWIAEHYGEPVGCVFLVKASKRVAKLRLFLVEPHARGLGIGRHLVQELVAFARSRGYYTIRLWTQSVLLAARHIYEQAGFRLIAEEPHHSFGHDLVAETWELRL
jgi:DNA-binding MarR family transcriptional regulator/N-acetylglutamate synthase-like GNAT family acetyltransferase